MYTARITLSDRLQDNLFSILSSIFEDKVLGHSMFEDQGKGVWSLQLIFQDHPTSTVLNSVIEEINAMKGIDSKVVFLDTWDVEHLPDRDWLAETYRQFPPFSVGPFFIFGSHYKEEIPPGQIPLKIDAAHAFGSGEHETTKGCLLAMLELKEQGVCPWNVLDAGTGSGILAIAAWKLWKTPVLAIDNDEEAVKVARHYRDENGVPGDSAGMSCIEGDAFKDKSVLSKKPFDLVIANILAAPLKEGASDLEYLCDENGYMILSGILNEQAEGVIDAYTSCGLSMRKHDIYGEWSTLLFHKR